MLKRISRGKIKDEPTEKEFDYLVKQLEDDKAELKTAVNSISAVTPSTVTAEELGTAFNLLLTALKNALKG